MDRETQTYLISRLIETSRRIHWPSYFLGLGGGFTSANGRIQDRVGAERHAPIVSALESFLSLAETVFGGPSSSFLILPKWVLAELLPYLASSETKVLLCVVYLYEGQGRTTVSARELQGTASLGKNAVSNALRELENAGVIKWRPYLGISSREEVNWNYLKARKEWSRERDGARTIAATKKAQEIRQKPVVR